MPSLVVVDVLAAMFRVRESGKPAARMSWLAVGIVFCTGCAVSSEYAIRPGLGENFELRVGQSAIVSDAALEVGFEAVSADSRCAKGTICVWEGDAIVRIRLQPHDGTVESVELHTSSKGPGSATFDGYGIRLVALAPLAISGHAIAPSAYVVTLNVTPGAAGGEATSRF